MNTAHATFQTINPATGEPIESYPVRNNEQLEQALALSSKAQRSWKPVPIEQRLLLFKRLAELLTLNRENFARLISLEMGKLLSEALAEVDKCASTCEYYGTHSGIWLQDEPVSTEAQTCWISYEPIGTVLAIMPWNFPFWQVFRASLGPLLAGNTLLLKHAPNVCGCALALERLFLEAGFPEGVFQAVFIPVELVENLLADSRIHGVCFTGSVASGRQVAALAGINGKKSILELGGSDPYLVLEDANLDTALKQALKARFLNAGQVCISAKRFIVMEPVAAQFIEGLKSLIEDLVPGDPLSNRTSLAPLARSDLREILHRQVTDSIKQSARVVTGCSPLDSPGYFYQASLIADAHAGMPVLDEELFGPVAVVTTVKTQAEAVNLANQTPFGLGASVWTQDLARGQAIARQLQCGMVFVNALVKSDPRLPCGGSKASGYGRELAALGAKEFTNAKVYWMES